MVHAAATASVRTVQSVQLASPTEFRFALRAAPTWPNGYFRLADAALAAALVVAIVIAVHVPAFTGGFGALLAMRITLKNFLLLGVFACYWQAALSLCGVYGARHALGANDDSLWRLVRGCTLGSAGAVIFPLTSQRMSLAMVPVFWLAAMLGTIGLRAAVDLALSAKRKRSAARRLVLVGSGPRAAAMWADLRSDPLVRYELVSLFDTDDAAPHPAFADRSVQALGALERSLMHTVVDQVVIALPVRSRYAEIEAAIRTCERAGVESSIPADVFRATLAQPRLDSAGRTPVVAMQVVQTGWRSQVKRATDIAGAGVGLLVISPLLAAVALAVKLTSPGPVFFAQERYGLQKRRFKMYKFRTMVADAEAQQSRLELHNEATGPVFKIQRDPRVTAVGRLLRRTSIDELPQLWNVLRGEMSLVGPRPLPLRDVGRFDEPWLMRRLSVRPGLPCLWQVSGRSTLGFNEWIHLDLEYIDRWSLALDARILLRTFPAVIKGTGAT
jgi:exopolysaccharide biosynthesis polyprenyl glycosylphosphotransferase